MSKDTGGGGGGGTGLLAIEGETTGGVGLVVFSIVLRTGGNGTLRVTGRKLTSAGGVGDTISSGCAKFTE